MRIDETGPETLDSAVLDGADPADVAEQRADVDDSVFDADPDELPLEADPADVAEQGRVVPYDDER
jgi:hypothetical protein